MPTGLVNYLGVMNLLPTSVCPDGITREDLVNEVLSLPLIHIVENHLIKILGLDSKKYHVMAKQGR